AAGDFDPEDVRYSTFRWITTDMGFAMGPSRANPLTGEIIDADIIFDASMVRFWKQEYKMTRSGTAVSLLDQPSSIKAARLGWGLDHPLLHRPGEDDQGWNEPRKGDPKAREVQLRAFQQGLCQCGAHMKYELGLAAMAAALQQVPAKPGDKGPAEKVPEELIAQAIKHVVMHEVGHTLGLRHNFKASTMLKNEDLHNTAITRKQGLVGSVMDYSPANIARKGQKQGDYFSVVLGPYDYWAIEYAYKPLGGGTDGEYEKLKEIANRGAMPGHDYGTDEDTVLTEDPLINRWDLGADPAKFGQDRILLAQELMKELADKAVEKGEGYQRTRMAFSLILQQYGNGAYLTVRHVGGEHAHRDHKGDPNGRDPLVPVKADKQREALKFLQENILTDKPFQFPPALLRKLAVDRWSHWGSRMSSTDYPVHQRVLNIQRLVLDHVLDPEVLQRIQNNSLKVDGKDERPLTLAEVFRVLTDGIWSDLPNGGPKHPVPSSIVRRNLQREHLKDLSDLVLGQKPDGYYAGSSAPPDARSLARMHLREISKRIDATLNDRDSKLDDTTRAHLEECRERIAKVLGASITIREP
ncbi:MAG TPA: zinc-dependent metalloprotease, partial [Gemmataceae bacterium]|nr:zinc-dependent metalloprotease [Gemmataceae bacterium]